MCLKSQLPLSFIFFVIYLYTFHTLFIWVSIETNYFLFFQSIDLPQAETFEAICGNHRQFAVGIRKDVSLQTGATLWTKWERIIVVSHHHLLSWIQLLIMTWIYAMLLHDFVSARINYFWICHPTLTKQVTHLSNLINFIHGSRTNLEKVYCPHFCPNSDMEEGQALPGHKLS